MKKLKNIFLIIGFIALELGNTCYAQYTVLHDFAGVGDDDGGNPCGSLISDGTFLYGMTSSGGVWYNDGTLFKIMPDGSGYSLVYVFDDGKIPLGSLVYDGTYLYGMTQAGGINGKGIIFKIKPDGTDYIKLLDFAGAANGRIPRGSLSYDGTYLYGMTLYGGTSDKGVIFKIMPDGTGFSKLHDFTGGSDGKWPEGSLLLDGTSLYGMVSVGGIFKIMSDGTGFSTLLNFTTATGTHPKGSLISDGTYLYGMTAECGSSAAGKGVVFKMMPDGTGYSILHYFDDLSFGNGFNPHGSLIYDGTFLYGMTHGGGMWSSCLDGCGVVFKIKPDGTEYTNLYDFSSGSTGSEPWGDLLINRTSMFGLTSNGGANNYGVIFKYDVTTTVLTENNSKNDFKISPNPFTLKTTIGLSKEYSNATLKIVDILGKEFKRINFSGNSVILEREELKSGMYFIQIISENELISTNKIIIN